jgi:ferrous iron transport protein B
MKKELVIALASQPNIGKTTLFNTLTKSRGYVANWPGKTVEVMQASFEFQGKRIKLIDLPGIRSLNALSEEEKLTKEFILSKNYDSLILLADAEALEKTFYFVVQVLEITNKAVVAINKYDEAHSLGLHINKEGIEEKLNCRVVEISALHKINLNQLVLEAINASSKNGEEAIRINYGSLEKEIEKISKILKSYGVERSRIASIKLFEGDDSFIKSLSNEKQKRIKKEVERIKKEFKKESGRSCEEKIISERYRFIEEILKHNVTYVKVAKKEISEAIDKKIFSNFYFGFVFSLIVLFSTLFISFSINTGFPLNIIFRALGNEELANAVEELSISSLISSFFDWLSQVMNSFLISINATEELKSLVINGLIAGFSSVAVFFPLIFIVNFFMGIVEDSGIMARSAVVFHRITSKFNLSGRVVFPSTMSLACNVPGIMSTRILESDKERFSSAIAIPFIICQARLVVLLFLTSIFFSSILLQAGIITLVYALSFLAFVLAYIFVSRIILKQKEKVELIEELPNYHFPSLRVVFWISWERSKSFLTKIALVIIPASIVIWFILHFGINGYTNSIDQSFGKIIGEFIAAIFPFKLQWQFGLSLLTGFIAKELVLETLAISFNTSNLAELSSKIAISKAEALAFIVFSMLYTPCVASLAAINSEKGKKAVLLSLAISFSFAYIFSLAVYFLLSFLA